MQARWEDDDALKALCDELEMAVRFFRILESESRVAFTPKSDPALIAARRDYEARWQHLVDHIAARDILSMFMDLMARRGLAPDDAPVPAGEDDRGNDLDRTIADWRDDAKEEAEAIEQMIAHVIEERGDDPFHDLDWVDASERAWDRLTRVAGLDIAGALWRRRAVPHILVPTHVSAHYDAAKASLYRRLHQAGLAFVFGAPLAALALQRAVLDEVLKRHWGAGARTVATARLPEIGWDIKASRLKRMANEALHGDADSLVGEALDRAVIENFLLLKLVIEGAPEAR